MSGILREALQAQSVDFNRRVQNALRSHPSLELGLFGILLKEGLAPAIEAIDIREPSYRNAAISQGFDLALEISALGLERGGFAPSMARLWKTLAGQVEAIAKDFRGEVSALSNALLFLRTLDGIDCGKWLAILEKLPPLGPKLRDAVMVAAWACGVAPWRKDALKAARDLTPEAFAACTGLSGFPGCLDRLEADPWHIPDGDSGARLVRYLGEFLGNDGLFLEPPKVRVAGDRLIVEGGRIAYELHADAFGVLMIPHAPATAAAVANAAATMALGQTIECRWKGRDLVLASGSVRLDFPERGRQAVGVNGVIAVHSPYSFRIAVVSPGAQE